MNERQPLETVGLWAGARTGGAPSRARSARPAPAAAAVAVAVTVAGAVAVHHVELPGAPCDVAGAVAYDHFGHVPAREQVVVEAHLVVVHAGGGGDVAAVDAQAHGRRVHAAGVVGEAGRHGHAVALAHALAGQRAQVDDAGRTFVAAPAVAPAMAPAIVVVVVAVAHGD